MVICLGILEMCGNSGELTSGTIKANVLGDKPVPVTFHLPQIPHKLKLGLNLVLPGERQGIKFLGHSGACYEVIHSVHFV
jgi:hypothetical protein